MKDLRQKAVKGVVWSVIQSWGSQSISFIVFLLLARMLDPKEFGLVALASVFIAFIQIFRNQGLSKAIIQRHELEPEHIDTAFWITLSIGFVLAIISVLVAPLVSALYGEPDLQSILRWLSLSFIFVSLSSVQEAILQRKLAFRILAVRSLLSTFLGGLVGLVMAFQGAGVWSLVGQQLANVFFGALTLWSVSGWRPSFYASKKHFLELFSFGINVVGINIMTFINRRSDDLLIGYFLGAEALGYYTVAYRVLQVMIRLLATVINKVALPTFSKLQRQPERMRRAFYTVTQLTSLIAFPTFLGVLVLAPELVRVLFGEKWTDSVRVMQVLSFVGLLLTISYFNGSILMAMGKPSWKLRVQLVNSIANIIGFSIAVIYWKTTVAVATSFAIVGYLLLPIPLLLIRKLIKTDISVYLKQCLVPAICSVIMVSAILLIRYFAEQLLLSDYTFLIVSILFGLILYSVSVYLMLPALIQRVIGDIKLVASSK